MFSVIYVSDKGFYLLDSYFYSDDSFKLFYAFRILTNWLQISAPDDRKIVNLTRSGG